MKAQRRAVKLWADYLSAKDRAPIQVQQRLYNKAQAYLRPYYMTREQWAKLDQEAAKLNQSRLTGPGITY